jgi:hypothetical protein
MLSWFKRLAKDTWALPKLIDLLDDVALKERRVTQYKKVLEELFPEDKK